MIISAVILPFLPVDATVHLAAKGIVNSTLVQYDGAARGLFATRKERLISDVMVFLQSIRSRIGHAA